MTVMAIFLSLFHINLHTHILGVHFDVQKLGFFLVIMINLNYPGFFIHINKKKLFSPLMLMFQSVNVWLKDVTELNHT